MAKYTPKEKDDIRKELLNIVNKSSRGNEHADSFNYDNKLLDVTGSLGCWGIVQLNNSGQMVRK